MPDYKVNTPRAIEGSTFQDALKSATGKEVPTTAEFESAMRQRGYADRDVRRMTKAYDRIKRADDRTFSDFVLREGYGYEFKGGSGSGKRKGNVKGFDVGDLIGLGNNTALLAGALRNELTSAQQTPVPKTDKAKSVDAARAKSTPTTKFSPSTTVSAKTSSKGSSAPSGEQMYPVGRMIDRMDIFGPVSTELGYQSDLLDLYDDTKGSTGSKESASGAPSEKSSKSPSDLSMSEFKRWLFEPVYDPRYEESSTIADLLRRGAGAYIRETAGPIRGARYGIYLGDALRKLGIGAGKDVFRFGKNYYDFLQTPINLQEDNKKKK